MNQLQTHTLRLFFTLFICLSFSCRKSATDKKLQDCVKNKLDEFEKGTNCDDANVKEYIFQGVTVYAFDPGNCGADMTTEIINSECTSIGYLGGITGNTFINGEDFSSALFIKTIWDN